MRGADWQAASLSCGMLASRSRLSLAAMKRTDIRPGVFTLEHVVSVEECDALIRRAEAQGFEFAPIATPRGFRIDTETRNNDRVIFDDLALAGDLWSRVCGAIPAVMKGRQAVGLNERFRLYRYAPSQRFSWHSDGAFRRDNGEVSLLTFMIYLNDDYRGGTTRFEDAEVVGRTGMALVFRHELQHEGATVVAGQKYALRSDVMYGRVGQYGG